jgi:aspartokinase
VKNARVLSRIAPAEAAELSWFGAEVIHPFTMEHVVKAQVPIRIKNTLNPAAPGTLIDPTADYVKEPLPHNRCDISSLVIPFVCFGLPLCRACDSRLTSAPCIIA